MDVFDANITNWEDLNGENQDILVFRFSDLTNYYTEEELGEEFQYVPEKINELTIKSPGLSHSFRNNTSRKTLREKSYREPRSSLRNSLEDEMVSDLNSRSDLWADPSITRNAVGKYRCDRLIPPLRSSGSDLYGRDRQYKNTQFIKTAYRVAGRYSLSRLWFLRIGGDRSSYPKDIRPSGRRDRFRRKRGLAIMALP